MSKSSSTTRSRMLRAGIAAGTVAAAVVGIASPALAAAALTLSANSGPSGGGNTIIATAPTAIFGIGVTPTVTFQSAGVSGSTQCATTLTAPVLIAVNATTPFAQTAGTVVAPAPNVVKLTSTKIVVTVPSSSSNDGTNTGGLALGTSQTVGKYNMCVYNGSTVGTSTLLASAVYTIAAAPTVTAVVPTSGPALGGTAISVTGTGFTTGMTATIGGVALSNVVVGAGGTSFTATTPSHAAATAQTITVNATGGAVTSSGLFAFTNGITVTPSTVVGAANGGTTAVLDITGVGFSTVGFPATPVAVGTNDAATAVGHIFLVKNRYLQTLTAGVWTNPPVAECGTVLVINDGELICTLDVTSSIPATTHANAATPAIPDGAYTVTIVNTGVIGPTAPTYQTDVTSPATLTVSAY
jgi:hypothetical protein